MATAASTAVPPSWIASAPMRDAISFCDATMPFFDRTGTEIALSVMTAVVHATMHRRERFMGSDYTLPLHHEATRTTKHTNPMGLS